MKYLNENATRIFKKLIEHLNGEDHVKIKNNSAYIPLTVEKLYDTALGPVYSLCHYSGPVEGDWMKDPDGTFVITEDGIAPLEWQNDYASMYTEAATIEGGKLVVQSPSDYSSLVSFANAWLVNIKEQQGIEP